MTTSVPAQAPSALSAPSAADAAVPSPGPAPSRRTTFHPLTVTEVRRLTEDAIEVTFAVPEALTGSYDYLPGQYVALRTTMDGTEVRRSYSICAEPRPGEIRVAIKRDLGGRFSTWANESLKAGDVLDVMSPAGGFISKHPMNGLNHPEDLDVTGENVFVAVAAGSGITPVIAIARTVLAASESTRFDLVYANKAAMDVMFLEELADLKDRYPARFALHHVLSREQRISPLLSGRIDAEKLSVLIDSVLPTQQVDEWFLCGPFELVQMCRDALAERGVDAEKVRFELFSTGQPGKPEGSAGRPVAVEPGGDNYSITFRLDGLQGKVASPTHARESILNAALRVRPDVPFACAGGVCGTCRAKVVTGTVEMDENYALEPDELAKGYILTCQSRPTSPDVTVDYDA
ncbi:1,2-phenylacetyl-CoA epoxidase subunit PaaE [Arthrobacter sunyaminii]|uniref:Phenylacetate-CoA oxygenase/reductase subunit PaaK n=1 Tax=Arthrobacter sunyaminii TaxID=2816859 RepID=A0A975PFI5_9MICC|nr:1,2-phenylacetyl-CoA epoxidase subunit PaaE [Arthrobacter sunyaminii]MBO0897414.1 phenylacetate-CoA oxygenase/reductase subunit PaaK [Arthrobacter sunyaminii]MBO0908664.1 phenylacetate-CoA oxygenase/reductase subunit PaaK [Arthrobacter sunyaminii]QWQ35812.1 phenylacetate-CoA oxygenase/reductase subunit PaaK [Arthrobacter sunyaminii]